MQRLLIQAKEDGCYELLLLELSAGLRRGELLALQWDDLDLGTGELCISGLSMTIIMVCCTTKFSIHSFLTGFFLQPFLFLALWHL